jgi:hypothetical protein
LGKDKDLFLISVFRRRLEYPALAGLPYVRQTLMTARRLFSNDVLGPAFDYKTGINVSFEALQDLAAMHDIRKDLRARFDKIAEDLKKSNRGAALHDGPIDG